MWIACPLHGVGLFFFGVAAFVGVCIWAASYFARNHVAFGELTGDITEPEEKLQLELGFNE